MTIRLVHTCILLSIAAVGCTRQPAPAPAGMAAATSAAAQSQAFYATPFSRSPSVAAMTDMGRVLFFDAGMSASGKLACATCHDPNFAYGPPDRSMPSGRAIPSLRYLQTVPPFSEHHFDEAIDESVDQGPTGGHTWDGRADTVHDQALIPLLSPAEMANRSTQDLVEHLQRGTSAAQFRDTFGADVFDHPDRALKGILLSLEVFQQDPREFYPYSSKYDAWLRGQTALTKPEVRGLQLFSDPAKGNCSSCHPSQILAGSFPQFTDYGFIALGVPRNNAIADNANPRHYDLGLCGPLRTDLRGHADYCGRFRAPTLRNVALRRTFFHNGVFNDLRRAIEFYAQRDTNPEKFYPKDSRGRVIKYDDLPAANRANVNVEPPFGGPKGAKPPLSAAEIDDLIAFLKTLNDGFSTN